MKTTPVLSTELSQTVRLTLQLAFVTLVVVLLFYLNSNLYTESALVLAAAALLAAAPIAALLQTNRLEELIAKRHGGPDLYPVSGVVLDSRVLLGRSEPALSEATVGRTKYRISDLMPGHNQSTDLGLFIDGLKTLNISKLNDNQPNFVINRTGDQTLVFVSGNGPTITNSCGEIWDHGHNRTLTAADRRYFNGYIAKQAAAQQQSFGLAFAVLPKDLDRNQLTLSSLGPHLSLLGLITAQHELNSDAMASISAIKPTGAAISLLFQLPPDLAQSLAKALGLPASTKLITADIFGGLSDRQLVTALKRGVIFSQLSQAEQRRLTELTASLSDFRLLKKGNLQKFVASLQLVQHFRINLIKTARCITMAVWGLLILTLIGIISSAVYHVGPAVSPLQLIVVGAFVIALPLTALITDKPHQSAQHEDWRNRLIGRYAAYDLFGVGLLIATLSFGNFILFFNRLNISPSYMASDTPLYLQATTLAWVTFVMCVGVQLIFERVNTHKDLSVSHITNNKKLFYVLIVSLLISALIIYVPLLASLFRSAPLSLYDWLTVLGAAGLFGLARLLQRQIRRHSRESVIRLHREIHG